MEEAAPEEKRLPPAANSSAKLAGHDTSAPTSTAVSSVHDEEKSAVVALDASSSPAAAAAPSSAAAAVRDGEKAGKPESAEEEGDGAGREIMAGQEEEPPKQKGRIAMIMVAICLAVFLAAIDVTIITTALPSIIADFNGTESDYTWVGSSYMLAAAATTPSWGKVSDIFGRKPILLTANVIFFVGSLICALSVNVHMLVGGRVLQGIGAGGLLTLSSICIADMFSVRDRSLYFSLIGLTWATAGSIGPVLGGAFSSYVTWRWNFWINLPLDGIAFVLLVLFLDIHNPKTPLVAGLRAIDWIGTALVVGGTCMFLLGLDFGGNSYPWQSATVICLIVFGILVLVSFVIYEWKVAEYPLMPPRLFKSRSNIAALTIPFLHGFVFISDSYFLPQYFQVVLGVSPILSGVYLLPFIVPLCLFSVSTGIFIKVTGQYLPPIYFGMIFLTIGQGLYIDLKPYISWTRIIIFQILAGTGAGPNFQAPLIALHSGIEPRDMAAATSTFNFGRNLGTAISVVVGGSIFSNQISARRDELAAALPPALVNVLGGAGVGSSIGIVNALPEAQKNAVRVVYTESLKTLWIFYLCIAFLGLLTCFLLQRTVLSKKHEEHKTGLATEQQRKQQDLEAKKKVEGDVEAVP